MAPAALHTPADWTLRPQDKMFLPQNTAASQTGWLRHGGLLSSAMASCPSQEQRGGDDGGSVAGAGSTMVATTSCQLADPPTDLLPGMAVSPPAQGPPRQLPAYETLVLHQSRSQPSRAPLTAAVCQEGPFGDSEFLTLGVLL